MRMRAAPLREIADCAGEGGVFLSGCDPRLMDLGAVIRKQGQLQILAAREIRPDFDPEAAVVALCAVAAGHLLGHAGIQA